jgi:uridylate kinase
MIKATKVNGIYNKDPVKNKDAKIFESITYKEVLEKNIRVMDLTAVSLAKEYKLPLKVVSLYEE